MPPLPHELGNYAPHSQRYCPRVTPIWSTLFGTIPIASCFQYSSTFDWIQSMTAPHQHITTLGYIPWPILFPVAAWSIWSARNKTIMEASQFNYHTILKKINAFSTDLHFVLLAKHDIITKTTMHIGWTPPPHGFFKLKTDGLVRNNPGDTCASGII